GQDGRPRGRQDDGHGRRGQDLDGPPAAPAVSRARTFHSRITCVLIVSLTGAPPATPQDTGPAARLRTWRHGGLPAGSGCARRVKVPLAGDALQRVLAAVIELDA